MLMLVPVQKITGFCVIHVIHESRKTEMNLVVAVMNISRRIMRYENIYLWKIRQYSTDFILLKKPVSFRFVTPCSGKSSKSQTIKLPCLKMQIKNWLGKDSAAVMIALYRKNAAAMAPCGSSLDCLVGKIPAGN